MRYERPEVPPDDDVPAGTPPDVKMLLDPLRHCQACHVLAHANVVVEHVLRHPAPPPSTIEADMKGPVRGGAIVSPFEPLLHFISSVTVVRIGFLLKLITVYIVGLV